MHDPVAGLVDHPGSFDGFCYSRSWVMTRPGCLQCPVGHALSTFRRCRFFDRVLRCRRRSRSSRTVVRLAWVSAVDSMTPCGFSCSFCYNRGVRVRHFPPLLLFLAMVVRRGRDLLHTSPLKRNHFLPSQRSVDCLPVLLRLSCPPSPQLLLFLPSLLCSRHTPIC